MKSITSNLLQFAFFFALGSILFRFGLSWSINNHAALMMWIFAILYFIFNFSIAWYFGKKDYLSIPINDVGLRFHLVTYVAFNSIWELCSLLGLKSRVEKATIAHEIALIWGILLFFHFILYMLTRKNTIKGLNKSDIFE
jgi:hypothetical protein